MSNHGRTRSKSALALTLGLFISTSISYPAFAQTVHEQQYIVSISNDYQSITSTSSIETVSTSITRDTFIVNLPVASVDATPQVNVPASMVGGSLLDAARAQIGRYQDCTAMVENALRMLGYSVGDVGPMGFASYGVSVSPSDAQSGDIMMRGNHVAIYAGSGVAVHGGYNGTTVETTTGSSPYDFAVIIRVQH